MRPIVRDRIMKKCGSKCVHCGAIEQLEVDHIIPLSKGGRHDEDNLQILCRSCNSKKSNHVNYLDYFVLDESPEYLKMAVSDEFQNIILSLSMYEIGHLFDCVTKLHEKIWREKGHLYPGDYDVKTGGYVS